MTTTLFHGINWTSTLQNFTEDAAAICWIVEPQRIVSLCFSFIVATFLIYLVTALYIYSYKNKWMMGCRGTQNSSCDEAVLVVDLVIVCGAIFVFAFVSIEIPLLFPPTHLFCNIYDRMKTICYAGAIFCAYFALWYRVHSVFYRNSVMKQTISKPLQFLNITTIILLVLMVGINLFTFLSAPAFTNMPCTCRHVYSNENILVKWIVLVASTTAFQFTLLFTFIYPLHLHRKKMLNLQIDQRFIISVVKRAVAVAGVCVVSDWLNFVFAVSYKEETLHVYHIVHGCNLIVNIMGVFVSFANWREKLLPCR